MQGLQLTLTTLAESNNLAAIDVLVAGLRSQSLETRRGCVRALTQRTEFSCAEALLAWWDRLSQDEIKLIQSRSEWMQTCIADVLCNGGVNLSAAIDAARILKLTSTVPELVKLAETSTSALIRRQATDAVLEQTYEIGHSSRQGRDQPTVRRMLLNTLSESVKRYARHGNTALVDAFLQVVMLSDGELRHFLADESQHRGLFCDRFRSSPRRGVVELCALFINRRDLGDDIARIIATRDCSTLRDCLITAVGQSPTATTTRNLREIGVPICCSGGETLLRNVRPEQRASLTQLYCAASSDPSRVMHVLATLAELEGPGYESVVVSGFAHCRQLEQDDWVQAAAMIATQDAEIIGGNEMARLLHRMIGLLDHPEPSIAKFVHQTLAPLHCENVLHRFASCNDENGVQLGEVVRLVDPDAVTRIRDGLRHPVLARRLDAIAAAESLAIVDQLSDSFKRIARNDHRDARKLAATVMGESTGNITLMLLQEMLDLPDGEVRDAAVAALEKRYSIGAH